MNRREKKFPEKNLGGGHQIFSDPSSKITSKDHPDKNQTVKGIGSVHHHNIPKLSL